MSRTQLLLLNAALLLISVALSIIVLEWAAGILYKRAPYANGKHTVAYYTGEPYVSDKDEAKSRPTLLPHPYMLYVNEPNLYGAGYQQTNSMGYRNEEFEIRKDPDTIRILCIGGSTTYMWPFLPNPKETWVAQLETKLRALTGKRIQVINAGLNYGTSAEALAGYVFRYRHLEPDVIIYHGGGNDVLPLFFDGYDPEYRHFRNHGAGLLPRPGERTMLTRSNIGKYLYARWLEPVGTVFYTEPFWEVPREVALERVKRTDPEGFRRNVEYLVTQARQAGSQVILFGFLQARQENLSKNAPSFKGYEEALVVGLQKNYAVMADIARRHGISFIIPPQDKFKDEWFQDNCHLTAEGERVKADILVEALKDNPLFKKKPAGV